MAWGLLTGKINFYKFQADGKTSVLLSEGVLDIVQLSAIEDTLPEGYALNIMANKVLKSVGKPKGTVEQGKKFLESKDIVLEVNKKGEVTSRYVK